MRSLVALVAALTLGWSSVVDNPTVCPDDWPGTATSHPCNDDGTPATPCVSCPCHLPSLRVNAGAVEPPLRIAAQPGTWPEQNFHAAEPVAPPTPPPLA